jgi:DNA-binding CsgD family transcriptional regulator
MPTYHKYSEVSTNGTPREPKAMLKNMGGMTTAEKIVAIWKATDLTYTEIGKLVGISRSGVSGAVDRYKRKHMGHKPNARGYYRN